MVEYFDRLDFDKIDQLRDLVGGELSWRQNFPRLSTEQKERVGEIVFGEPVKNVHVTFEFNNYTGFDIPVIHAKEVK